MLEELEANLLRMVDRGLPHAGRWLPGVIHAFLTHFPGSVLSGGFVRDTLLGIPPSDYDIYIPADLIPPTTQGITKTISVLGYEFTLKGNKYAGNLKGQFSTYSAAFGRMSIDIMLVYDTHYDSLSEWVFNTFDSLISTPTLYVENHNLLLQVPEQAAIAYFEKTEYYNITVNPSKNSQRIAKLNQKLGCTSTMSPPTPIRASSAFPLMRVRKPAIRHKSTSPHTGWKIIEVDNFNRTNRVFNILVSSHNPHIHYTTFRQGIQREGVPEWGNLGVRGLGRQILSGVSSSWDLAPNYSSITSSSNMRALSLSTQSQRDPEYTRRILLSPGWVESPF